MEPENTPLEKEKHLPNHHFQVLCGFLRVSFHLEVTQLEPPGRWGPRLGACQVSLNMTSSWPLVLMPNPVIGGSLGMMGNLQPLLIGNPYNGPINPYENWVDEFIPYYMEI